MVSVSVKTIPPPPRRCHRPSIGRQRENVVLEYALGERYDKLGQRAVSNGSVGTEFMGYTCSKDEELELV